ncbi:MAG: O-methyltransferase, partial [Hyphomicrobiales bacterium]|nr:O-methyltransferase [Hyphomicrobiales bacterium]
YLEKTILKPDPALNAALAANAAGGLPPIDVSALQGKLLYLLAKMAGARKALEIGTLGGYSSIWIARALPPEGRLVTLEAAIAHAKVARANLERAELGDKVDVRVGAALSLLPELAKEGLAPFDFVFIDADNSNNAAYVEWALRLSRPGTAIVVDNVIRNGAIADRSRVDKDVAGTRRMFETMAREPRLEATAIQTVGEKGWDGFALAVVR